MELSAAKHAETTHPSTKHVKTLSQAQGKHESRDHASAEEHAADAKHGKTRLTVTIGFKWLNNSTYSAYKTCSTIKKGN